MKQRMLKRIVLAVMVLLGGVQGVQLNTPIGQEINGIVTYVTDGDTMRVNGVKLRLWGIDTPEKGEKNYQRAGDFLAEMVLLHQVSCLVHTHDRYGRIVAQCTRTSDDADIGALMVKSGLAKDDPRYSKGYYSLVRNTD